MESWISAFISASTQTLSVLPGNGDGTFGQRIDLPTENSPWSLTAADFTSNGGLDLAVGIAVLAAKAQFPSIPIVRSARCIPVL